MLIYPPLPSSNRTARARPCSSPLALYGQQGEHYVYHRSAHTITHTLTQTHIKLVRYQLFVSVGTLKSTRLLFSTHTKPNPYLHPSYFDIFTAFLHTHHICRFNILLSLQRPTPHLYPCFSWIVLNIAVLLKVKKLGIFLKIRRISTTFSLHFFINHRKTFQFLNILLIGLAKMFTCRVASHAFEIEKGGGVVAKGIRGDGVRGV